VLNLSTEAGRNAEGAPKAGKGEKPKRSLKRYLLEKMQVWINSLLEAEREAFLAEVFLAGCSTRDWARITEKHLGRKYDSKQISRIVGRAS
jgi:hypothetical protein